MKLLRQSNENEKICDDGWIGILVLNRNRFTGASNQLNELQINDLYRI